MKIKNIIIATEESGNILLGTPMTAENKKIIDGYIEIVGRCLDTACTCNVTIIECPRCFAMKKIIELDREVLQNGRKE